MDISNHLYSYYNIFKRNDMSKKWLILLLSVCTLISAQEKKKRYDAFSKSDIIISSGFTIKFIDAAFVIENGASLSIGYGLTDFLSIGINTNFVNEDEFNISIFSDIDTNSTINRIYLSAAADFHFRGLPGLKSKRNKPIHFDPLIGLSMGPEISIRNVTVTDNGTEVDNSKSTDVKFVVDPKIGFNTIFGYVGFSSFIGLRYTQIIGISVRIPGRITKKRNI